jgi:hypothetical protein
MIAQVINFDNYFVAENADDHTTFASTSSHQHVANPPGGVAGGTTPKVR